MGPKFPVVSRQRFEALHADRGFTIMKGSCWADRGGALPDGEARRDEGQLQSLVYDFAAKALLSKLADVFGVMRLLPIATCRNKADWDRLCSGRRVWFVCVFL